MPPSKLPIGDWLSTVEVIAQVVVYALTATVTILLAIAAGLAALIAFGGTGGFTSDPAPAHPAWIGLFVIIALWVELQWCFIRLQRYLLKVIDGMGGADKL